MSAATITKRGCDLKVGDVINLPDYGNCSLLYFASTVFPFDQIQGRFGSHSNGSSILVLLDPMATYESIPPALTPAQQHAEELVVWVRRASRGQIVQDDQRALCELLAMIDPPVPPTLEEALSLIQNLINMKVARVEPVVSQAGLNLLDRARRAGLLKSGTMLAERDKP